MAGKNPWDNGDEARYNNLGKQLNDWLKFLKSFNNDFNKKHDFHFVATILILLFVGWCCSGFYRVESDEKGIVLRLGRWKETTLPGLNYHLPYPFEEVIIQKVTTIYRIDIGNKPSNPEDGLEESLMLTGDSNLASINFTVLWKIENSGVEAFLFTARSPEVIVKAVAESVMRSIIGRNTIVYAQTNGRSAIAQEAKLTLQELMDEYNTGVEIVDVNLQNVEPPMLVIDSFRDVERAQADQQRMINEADAYSRNILANANGKASEIVNKAEGKRASIIAEADGLTSRFLAVYEQYKLAPDIISKRMYFDTMEKVLKNVEVIIADKSTGVLSHFDLNNKNSQQQLTGGSI